MKIFKIYEFLSFSLLSLATGSRVEAPLVSLLRMVRDSLHDLLASRLPNREKHFRQIFQNLCHGILATWPGDLFAAHSSCEKCMFCTNRFIFKKVFINFSIFPLITCLFIVLFASSSSKTTNFSHKTSNFFINPSSIFKKRYEFSIILKVFHVSSPRFLGFCVYVEIRKYDDWIWFYCCFVEIALWVLLVLLV